MTDTITELPKLDNEFVIFGLSVGEPWATLIRLALIILIGMAVSMILMKIIRHILKKLDSLDDMLNAFILNVVKVICIIVIIAACLDTLGVNMGTIVAVIGAAGAAIALALKDSLANIAGGLMIIITKPFGRGDLIRVGTYRGRVLEIDLFLTRLRTLNYEIITVPNGLVNTSILVNESREEIRRVDLQFGISYDSDVDLAKQLLRRCCEESPLVIKDKEPSIGVSRHDDSAVVLDLLAWCRTEDYFKTEYDLNERVQKVFDENGIRIPFPQMDIHLDPLRDRTG